MSINIVKTAGESERAAWNVLVIDDETGFLNLVSNWFPDSVYSVFVQDAAAAEEYLLSPQKAPQLTDDTRFHFVLTDYQLGADTGCDVISTIETLDYTPKTALISAHPPHSIPCIEQVDDFIEKSLSKEDIRQCLRRLGVMEIASQEVCDALQIAREIQVRFTSRRRPAGKIKFRDELFEELRQREQDLTGRDVNIYDALTPDTDMFGQFLECEETS